MRVVSVNISGARSVPWKGRTVTTGIFKAPVTARVRIHSHGLEGDAHADPTVHGGPLKAVYAYPSEHYRLWQQELPGRDWPWGTFGENLTTEGLAEDGVRVGDRFRMGTAVLEATKPRFPCYKLGIRLGDEGIIDRFLRSGRSGIFFGVAQPGDVAAGDSIEPLRILHDGMTIADLVDARIAAQESVE